MPFSRATPVRNLYARGEGGSQHSKWRLSINALAQIGGQLAPLAVAAAAIPLIYRQISASDFGVFTLALSALSLFAMMDLGLGRATVRFVSAAISRNDSGAAARTCAQSVILLGAFSLLLTVLFAVVVPAAMNARLRPGGDSERHIRDVVYVLAASIPFVGLTSVFRSVLEAQERFPLISVIQSIFGSLSYAVPATLSLFTSDIRVIVGGAVVCRVSSSIAFFVVARARWLNDVLARLEWRIRNREFLRFSVWLIVSNVVGNSVIYADRGVLAGMFPLSTLAYYNVPLEFLTRIMILVNGSITAAFPYMSKLAREPAHLERAHGVGVALIASTIAPILLVLSLFAPKGLELWLGPAFQAHSSEIVRILLVGLLFLSANAFSLASLNARGVSGRIAAMHAIEAPIYVGALYYAARSADLRWIALVWSARMVIEFVCYETMLALLSTRRIRQVVSSTAIPVLAIPLTGLIFSVSSRPRLEVGAIILAALLAGIAGSRVLLQVRS